MPTELHDALMRISGTASATNVTHTISRVQGAVAAGGRAALLKLSSSELRTYGHAIGISSKGLQPELALRIWQHLEQAKAPRDSSELCTHDHADRNGLQPQRRLHQTIGKQSITSTAAPLFIRRAHEENVFRALLRPFVAGKQQGRYRSMGRTDTMSQCESRCSTQRDCEAYTWFSAEAPELWANWCIAQNLARLSEDSRFPSWQPHISHFAFSAVKVWVDKSAAVLSPRGNALFAGMHGTLRSASLTFCSRRMEVHAGKLDMAVMEGHVPTAWYTTPGECHQSCQNSHSCERSVWVSTGKAKASPVHHACFQLPELLPDTPMLVNSRKASSARKSASVQLTWDEPYDVLARHLFPPDKAVKITRIVQRAAGHHSRLALVALQREQLPLARQFLCELGRWTEHTSQPILWLCADDESCSFLRERSLHSLVVETYGLARKGDPLVSKRLQVAIHAILLGIGVLLADVGAMWVASPWPMLTSKLFDVVSAPDQRFGEGFGFPLGADFCYFQSTNSSINLLIQLADRMEATQESSSSYQDSLGSSLNDLLFYGMDANRSIVPGRFGAQLRRVEWSELRVKVLDMEAFPAAHVSSVWWRNAGRIINPSSRVIVVRTDTSQKPFRRIRALRNFGSSSNFFHSRASSGAGRTCAVTGQTHSISSAMTTHPIISVVMLSHGHAFNVNELCRSLLPCQQATTERLVEFTVGERGTQAFSLQAVVVEDGSADNSRAMWRQHLATPHGPKDAASLKYGGVSWKSQHGQSEVGVAFPAPQPGRKEESVSRWNDSVADILLLAPNQHEIRSYHQGFTMAWGDVLVTLQDDELYVKDDRMSSRRWLADALTLLQLHPDLSMISCNAGFLRDKGFACDMFDPKYRQNCCYINKTSGCWGEEIAPIPMHDPRLPKVPFMFVAGLNFGPFIVRRRAYFELGGFDTSWSAVGDPGIGYDIEFSLRAQQRGHLIGVMECGGIQRRVGGGSSLASAGKRKLRFVMERRNNMRLDNLFFNDKSLMNTFIKKAMHENHLRLAGSLPTW